MKSVLHPLRRALVALCATSALAAAPSAFADYPERAISLVVGYPAGGSVDLTARLFGEELAKRMGQSVVVENVGGAGGTIGAQRVARAAPDGYTLLLGSTNEMVIARMINSAVKYDSVKDFSALGVIASQPMLLAASKNSGVKTAAEYLQKLRASAPGSFNYGSSGVGTTLHLAGEMINQSTGTRAEHVPYRGVAPLVTDLMSGQLDYGMLVLSSGLPQVRGDKIVALGVTEKTRSPVAPDLPALAETPGFESVDISVWFALYGPAGLPEPVAAKLRTALADTLKSEQFRAKMQEAGGVLSKPGLDPVAYQAEETKKYGALVKAAKIEAQ
ncbi:Bug family tripartite tricarboxylate transporter substrate binding protein [Achromobacter deleyi]|uniref:Bug family tripartite tricarboxylate transporter substrate binding protein n=1 Tax=Achromobacter deleyi TaxID=1353891 RepID=UPI0014919240|nr:tripartite tricarboxylate transporter substrate binding protein [Achromobacter deleyi]QVQ25072.1 tripartite tricarboxylate transporter substrate binding protein [Achromobacter deleyi]UIP20612.1 tripartite tricarboxylate transporter substrate binding protein [Achromobacter deleyi]